MASVITAARSTFKNLLQEIDLQLTQKTNNPYWREQLQLIYKERLENNSPEVSAKLQADAQDILTYLESSRKHKELLERYNPHMNITPDERLNLTANRVGLQLPKAFNPDE
ncbi:hypothetical protein K493DRAFT_297233 [Basidiobolus meristosporus CBS 931.73]|uniref:Uncharacterized protein n=1 Tax=Basidiobolus meristosporus CBS 931.73 TaxID=1314790 RepID=A0A1Y1Z178_9FUNG|nr:hypothetical protein K493DRAFT_297233 [Basidiobolus meristosporus CBS 931.73]|eukprot:ORY03874.1 hypothetical protein K493DRAFT_297233 [Basidiobolus meristosporus CBS 931.73]